MNILVLTSSYPKSEEDSTSPYVKELYAHMAQKGHTIHIVLPHYPGGPAYEYRNHIHLHYFRYGLEKWETLCYGSGIPEKIKKYWKYRFMFILFFVSQLFTAARLIQTRSIDLISCHWLLSALSGLILKHFFRLPMVLTIYGVEIFIARNIKFLKRLCEFIFPQTSSIITISSPNMKLMQQYNIGKSKLKLIPVGPQTAIFRNGCTLSSMKPFKPMSRDLPVNLLFAGRLVERKGVQYLLRAIPAVHAKIPNLKLHIVGDGPEKRFLEYDARILGISDIVHFHGFIAAGELGTLYAKSHMFIFPSIVDSKGDTEGLGIVTFEAWAYGLPVIASQVGGIVDTVIHEKTGLLVEQKNSHAISEAILRLTLENDLARAMVVNGQRMLHETFHWNTIADEYINEFKTILK